MNKQQFLHNARWRKFQEQIWERDHGTCRFCGRDDYTLHYDTMKFGLVNPTAVKVVCLPCHRIWFGLHPDHLADDNPHKEQLVEIAKITLHLPKKFRAWYW